MAFDADWWISLTKGQYAPLTEGLSTLTSLIDIHMKTVRILESITRPLQAMKTNGGFVRKNLSFIYQW